MLGILLGGCIFRLIKNTAVDKECLTRRNIVVRLDRDVLSDLHIINIFQDGEPVSHTRYSHLFQLIVFERYESLALDTMLCNSSSASGAFSRFDWLLTDETLAILPQIQTRDELCAFLRCPLCYDRRWQA